MGEDSFVSLADKLDEECALLDPECVEMWNKWVDGGCQPIIGEN